MPDFRPAAGPLPPAAQPGSALPTKTATRVPETDVNSDSEVVGTIVRVTGGNFRVIERLMTQGCRLTGINGFDDISPDLTTAARQTLVIGTQWRHLPCEIGAKSTAHSHYCPDIFVEATRGLFE